MDNIERTLGGKYPVSIGTSVALEGMFGLIEGSHTTPSNAPYNAYQCIVFNLRTLARNYLSSYKAVDLNTINFATLSMDFVGEVNLIRNIVEDNSSGKLKHSIYNNTHEGLPRVLKKAIFKTKYTARQAFNANLESLLCDAVHTFATTTANNLNYEHTTLNITQGLRTNVILTHLPVDIILCNLHCDLLESHTGRIKPPHLFASKLKNASDNIPFNSYTIQIFGDTANTILPQASAIKAEVTELCKAAGFTAVTSKKRFYEVLTSKGSSTLASLLRAMK